MSKLFLSKANSNQIIFFLFHSLVSAVLPTKHMDNNKCTLQSFRAHVLHKTLSAENISLNTKKNNFSKRAPVRVYGTPNDGK